MGKSLDEDLEIVRELAHVLVETGLTEVELERGGLKLRVTRNIGPQVIENVAAAAPPQIAAPHPTAPAPQGAQPQAAAPETEGEAIRSPMVGTAYLSPSPGAEPFVSVGDEVAAGDTLLIVEAMKTMNAIKAPRAGKVAKVLARNAEPVEYDEPLVILGA